MIYYTMIVGVSFMEISTFGIDITIKCKKLFETYYKIKIKHYLCITKVSQLKQRIMTRKEFDALKEGDTIVFQKSGEDNGKTAIVYGLSDNGAIVYKYNGMLLVGNYRKFKL